MSEHRPSAFAENVPGALADDQLQRALGNIKRGFVEKRARAAADLPEFEALRDHARDIKNHTLNHLDAYLERYEARVREQGGHVHWCPTGADARRAVLDICKRVGAERCTKGKSMVSEEIGLGDALEGAGITPVETDLGEYILQLRHEPPSHIIAPAIHLNRDQIADDFRRAHVTYPPQRALDTARSLVDEARGVLRQQYLQADVGITGANLLVAETGQSVIVTNEGNGDLTQNLPRVHIVIASLEKVVPTLEDASTILRVLARSATGQEVTVYTTFSAGPRRADDPDGPDEFHVVLLDNGRTGMLGTEFQEMLRCIKCGACMNHCPVYAAVGGHAYGSTYVGPMGAVLTPALQGVDEAGHLPNASTFCGRCEEVCPVRIPLPGLMRRWREREFERHLTPLPVRSGLRVWAFAATRPRLYRTGARWPLRALGWLGRKRGRFGWLPLASGWTNHRDFPAPAGRTFVDRWAAEGHDDP
ncbi:L-lactate dehydrogenase complex protein LldF [Limimonas halophila]|uniref:L-lactate dehydrogenase complex protein LldF n=1 Tax=Limimonas halophila TaxID=1082479 RepID=A0A1G7SLC5_9PROT|nr:lactate utilization protein B [Limimonas halophila]SDG23887.1 L-lactate dehydrogenase complex protein LldF [Limimonas halophila]